MLDLRANRNCLYLLLLALTIAGLFALPAHADGGAPQLAYVAGTTRGVTVINIAQERTTGTIAVEGNPRAVLLSLDGQWLYVTQPEPGQVGVINASTGKTLCTAHLPGQPSLLALSLDASTLYAAGQGDTQVRALNPTTCAIQRTFETHEPVYGLAVTASTASNATPTTPNQLWITGTNTLTVFAVDGTQLGTVPISGGPQNICIPGGFTAYVTTRQGCIVAVDLNTRKVIRTLLSGGEFGPMDYDATTGQIYVPDQEHNWLDILTPITAGVAITPKEPMRIFHLNGSPRSVAITNDGQLGFVALSNGQVLMLDLLAREIVATITVGGTPDFIITGLYPPGTNVPSTSGHTTASTQGTILISGAFGFCVVLLGCLLWFFWRYQRRRAGTKAFNRQEQV